MDRFLRAERGEGRKEGIRWEGKGNPGPPLSGGSPLSINRGWEAAESEGQEQCKPSLSVLTVHAMNVLFNIYQVLSSKGF